MIDWEYNIIGQFDTKEEFMAFKDPGHTPGRDPVGPPPGPPPAPPSPPAPPKK